MKQITFLLLMGLILLSCGNDDKQEFIDEDQLGIIDADVKSEDTNLKEKAKVSEDMPGKSQLIERSFENAPPLIPHSTNGFFPIKIGNNICLSCHMPDKAKETGAKEIAKSHFANWRPKIEETDGVYDIKDNEILTNQKLDKLNNSYYNCSQCHVPQTEVTVDIENLFTPEFREKFGIEKSNLDDKVGEGIK